MAFRSLSYWFVCSALALIAVGAAEPVLASAAFPLPTEAALAVQPPPEPSRALLLFAGIMAMAFTYRRAWLNWKQSAQG